MMRVSRHILMALGLVAFGSVAAHAKPDPRTFAPVPIEISPVGNHYVPAEVDRLPKWAQKKITASRAKSIAMSEYPKAEVIDVKVDGDAYRVRLIQKNGRVVDVFVDLITGRIR